MQTDEVLKEYEKLGIDPPNSISHGVTMDDVRANMAPLRCSNWQLRGNESTCDTEVGPMSQLIDPGYILTGIDDKNMPILVKVEV